VVTARTRAEPAAPSAISPALDAGGQLSLFAPPDAVSLRHSRRAKRLALRVFPHGVVEVVIPPRTARHRVEEFLRSHAGWIAQARRALLGVHASPSVDPPGEIVLAALAERWRIAYAPGEQGLEEESGVREHRLKLRGPADAHWRRSRLRSWLKDRAKAALVPWLEQVSLRCDLGYSAVSIRRQRSRWGSCSSDRRISLNCALLFVEPSLVEYLFVHELCHTRHLNHSRGFWKLVGRIDPDFEAKEAGLSQAWRQVPAWVSYDPPTG
jgi:predicted metal-dependent hydrolase